uniref:Ionotropic glutamate receptor C-terminal domain-containing protein n=1 Tax=Kalanchoe fedtschenkoi TaxID=63787 RepID=A0A7N0TCG1_KALFE
MKNSRDMMNMKKAFNSRICYLHGRRFFFIIMFLCVCSTKALAATGAKKVAVNIGVVLDMETMFGKKSLDSILMALYDFYSSHAVYQTRIKIHVRDSKQDVVVAASAALDLIKNEEVEAIIGPKTSMQAHFMLSLGYKARVPIISFSATSPSLSPLRNPYFFRATHNDSAQVQALSSLIEHFNWQEAVPVYVQNEYGEGIVPFLSDALQEVDCRMPYRRVIAPDATDVEIREELYKLMTMETRVFIVHMLPAPAGLACKLFKNAREIGMMDEGFVWIVTDGIGDMLTSLNSTALESMKGVLGIRTHIPKSKELGDFKIRWKKKFQSENSDVLNAEVDISCIRAYDAAVALAMAVEKVFSNGTAAFQFQRRKATATSTDLYSFGVSDAGPALKEALLSSRFEGFAGTFYFLNGEVPPYAYQIVNVDENGGREVGYWTAEGGISRFLDFNRTGADLKPALGPIIWPGESRSVPKGWQIPVNGKKLRVGVPMKNGFFEFVKVTRDPITNATRVSGYCKDVFEAVMQAMPYPVQHEYIPFTPPNGSISLNYNDLIYQVFLGTFDIVVGDVTIVANRSRFVDFTLPYTESGVSMIVPIKDHTTKNAWIFLKPLTWQLWITSVCCFIFIGFVVWVLEHRTNEDFRGPAWYQVGTMFWFSFSTVLFAQRERVVSNSARFVMIVWVFVVLILIQTYTASLTSLLTVKKLQPMITDVNELVKRGDLVGYQQGTFVLDLLKNMGFAESNLRQYDSLETLEEAFSKGDGKRTVAAVFDEIPYMRLFLGKHCSKYVMVGRTYKTDGFGFVFPKRSPLVPDVSRAILNVTEGEKMEEIESKWFGKQAACPDGSSASLTSSSIGLDSFWGLFLIAGISSLLGLILHATIFLYQHKHVLSGLDGTTSWWNKVVVMCKHFDDKDLRSHTYKKFQFRDNGTDHMLSAAASPHPMSDRVQTGFPISSDQGTPSDHGYPSSSSPISRGQISLETWVNVVDLADPSFQDSSPSSPIDDSSQAPPVEIVPA